MISRHLLLLVAATIAVALPAVAFAKEGEVKIVRVFTGWRAASSFKHISEYFDGRENTHGETMLRTHPDQRGGYYFLLRVANSGAPVAVKLTVQLIMPAGHQATSFTFATELKSGDHVLNLGLTGDDWPDAKANPVAWKLEVTTPDGHVLATEKSYLWEKPATR